MFKGLIVEKKDNRDVLESLESQLLELLEAELNFVEKGGYGRSVKTPWTPTLVFQDSPSCHCYPDRDHNDSCMLMRFVPAGCEGEGLPCHHIPLTPAGETLAQLESASDQEEIENAVKNWLHAKIEELYRGQTETGFIIT